MQRLTCSECKTGTLVRTRGDYETVYVDRDGDSHPLKVPGLTWLQCSTCGDTVLDRAAMMAIEEARREVLGLLPPARIRSLRQHLGRTQAAMSELLGIGDKTYCRWESGSYMQSEAFDRYLRLLLADSENVRLLEEIAKEKVEPRKEAQVDEPTIAFPYLRDIRVVEERSEVFIELMTRGELHVA